MRRATAAQGCTSSCQPPRARGAAPVTVRGSAVQSPGLGWDRRPGPWHLSTGIGLRLQNVFSWRLWNLTGEAVIPLGPARPGHRPPALGGPRFTYPRDTIPEHRDTVKEGRQKGTAWPQPGKEDNWTMSPRKGALSEGRARPERQGPAVKTAAHTWARRWLHTSAKTHHTAEI